MMLLSRSAAHSSAFRGILLHHHRALQRPCSVPVVRHSLTHGIRWQSSTSTSTSPPPTSATSSPPTATASPSTTSQSPSSPLLRALSHPARVYESLQQRRPLLLQLVISLVIYSLGDLGAQLVQSPPQPEQSEAPSPWAYDAPRGLRALCIGAGAALPSYFYFIWLGKRFQFAALGAPGRVLSLAAKVLFSQMFFTPAINTYFFGTHVILSGGSPKEAWERVRNAVPVSWLNSWKLWPAVQAVAFTLIRPKDRAAFVGVIAVGWQVYLSWLNGQAERRRRQEKADERDTRAVVLG